MNINTVLFDLDGTLVDTAPDLAYALNSLLEEHGLPQKSYADIKPLVALGGKALVKFGFTSQGGIEPSNCDESDAVFNQRHQRLLSIYTENIANNSKPFKGIVDILKLIEKKQLFWGVVTNKPENLTHLLLDKLSLKPDVVVCGDTLKYSKPHPAPLLYACAQLAIEPRQCVFVGDDKNDILAGKNAQIKTVAVTYGYGKVEPDWGYDFVINHPEALKQWM